MCNFELVLILKHGEVNLVLIYIYIYIKLMCVVKPVALFSKIPSLSLNSP